MAKLSREGDPRATLNFGPDEFRNLAGAAREHGELDAAQEHEAHANEAEAEGSQPNFALDPGYEDDLRGRVALTSREEQLLRQITVASREGNEDTLTVEADAYDRSTLKRLRDFAETSGDIEAKDAVAKFERIADILEGVARQRAENTADSGADLESERSDFQDALVAFRKIVNASESGEYYDKTLEISDGDKNTVMKHWDDIIASEGADLAKEFVRRLSEQNDDGQLSIHEASQLRDAIIAYEASQRPKAPQGRLAQLWARRPAWLGGKK
ncbi:MAG: hypothetical protein COV59_00615 [Candidatus Magasanikbacteria bacterium CG11_big_fil_rev_8_21_14_0_20_39_34]|uniref:Uncharacterized protein n=1 Tax=Candidatus Magasanikbacteria bacterium CG11_big_fil_rev_8_21_14_0_20_39_34 TaxID=1974653 RepID=A0A2H0N6G2_9BACT|nr:MAG: hypothetical protein COV59_00615 [Candidatus Magasanikbacteria bacterium CG11_big_fil_rev_8_21_14_0_20_39_34]